MTYLKIFISSVCFILASTLIISCNNDEFIIDNSISSIHVSTGEIYPAFNPEVKDYYINSLNTLNEIAITIDNFDTKKIFI